ncbi:glycosyltransferase family 39 protein [Roseomonas sp. ACRSG]|nr:glycosyltransferase family 39 protein [Roseomonas sp. ACRSG]
MSLRDALDRLPETRWPRLCLCLLCLLLWLPGFFTLPPGDRDESRFAQASRQMVESGDYVRIRYGEEDRNKKPVGIHWAQSASVHVAEALGLGSRDQIWPYRVPSLLGALLGVLATFHWGRALVGRRAAFLGAAMLASCLVLTVETHIAKTDAALFATVAAAMGLLGRAYLAPGHFSARQAAGFWLVLGLSILLKGPIGPMVVALAVVTLCIADRAGRWLRVLRPAWGIPLTLLVVLPWFVAIGIATEGRFFAEAVGGDMLAKVNSGEEAHWGPPGYYILTFLIAAFPAAFLVLRGLPRAWRDRLHPGTRFLLAWIIPSWLVFEAVATKLPHYSLPMYPPLMLLGAAWAMDPLRRPAPAWLRWTGIVALVLGAAGLGIASALLPYLADRRIDPVALLGIPAAALFLWVVLGEIRRGRPARAGLAAAVLAIPLYAVALEGVLPRLTAPWVGPRVAALLAEKAPGLPPAQFGVAGYHEPSQMFATGTGTVLLRNGTAAAAFLAEAPGRFAAVGDRDLTAFQAEAQRLGLTAQEEGSVEGFNYTRGRHIVLRLFRAAAP